MPKYDTVSKEKKEKKNDVSRVQNEAKADSLICVPLSPPQDIVVLDRIFPLIVTFPRFSIFSLSLSRSLFLSPYSRRRRYTLHIFIFVLFFFCSLIRTLFFSSTTRSRLNHI